MAVGTFCEGPSKQSCASNPSAPSPQKLRRNMLTSSSQDMEVYRRANVFERILSLYQSPSLSESAGRKILHIVYRAAQVGGSTTLITRAAVMSWIQVQLAEASVKEASLLVALAQKLYETSDRERVDAWSHGAIAELLAKIVRV